jgi:hypothetical protein
MTIVSIQNPLNFLDSSFREISESIRKNQSFEIISASSYNISYFVKAFFESFYIRSRFLRYKVSDYYFINLTDQELDLKEIDDYVLAQMYLTTGIEFVSLSSLLNYIEDQDKMLVLFTINNGRSEFTRFLLSYSYLFKNRVIYIVGTDQSTGMFEQKHNLEFSEAFLRYYVENILREMRIDNLNTDGIVKKSEGDLNNIYKVILDELRAISESNYKDFIEKPVITDHAEIIVEESLSYPIEIKEEPKYVDLVDKPILQEDPSVQVSKLKITSTEPSLTQREKAVYSKLASKKFLTRQEFANIVWGKGYKATNDAIDQVISRLRRKFTKSGYPKDYIYSKKGEGIELRAK